FILPIFNEPKRKGVYVDLQSSH
ncbi:uncharacterized protein METZ01_LOCUS470435, partial [marine metagenome]